MVQGPKGDTGAPGTNGAGADVTAAQINAARDAAVAAATQAQAAGNVVPSLELVPFTAFGNSWANGGSGSTNGSRYWDRIASRNRTKTLVNRGVSGTESNQILTAIVANWTPNQQGLVGLGDIVLNDLRHWATDGDRVTTRETFRSILARLNAWSVQDSTSASLVYGPGWNAGTSDATANRYVDVAWTGPAVNIRVGCVTTAGATVTVKDTSTGATVATFTTGGYKVAFEGVIRLTGYSAGNHTVRVSTSASASIPGAIVPMANPPLIVWLKAAPTIEGGQVQRDRIALYLAECASIVGGYPNVVPVEAGATGWDMATMLYAVDGLHPNDLGHAFIANQIQTALLNKGFTQGLNALTGLDSGIYTAPTPSYAAPGATAPAAPTGVTATAGNQASLTWARTSDGGATITGQTIQASSDSGTTWNTVATVGAGASSYTITSGLTAGTSYIFRVGATNAIGTTFSTASAAVTAGAAITTYAADDFNRADGPAGTTPVGGLAWATTNTGTLSIISNVPNITTTTNVESVAYVDAGQANGTIQATIASWAGNVAQGIDFRGSGTADGYVFWASPSTKVYTVSRRTAANTYVTAASIATPTSVVGDVLKVVLNGATVTCYINGTQVATFQDTTNAAKTRHGLWRGSSTVTTPTPVPDSFSFTS
jgi:hypothetical protein